MRTQLTQPSALWGMDDKERERHRKEVEVRTADAEKALRDMDLVQINIVVVYRAFEE